MAVLLAAVCRTLWLARENNRVLESRTPVILELQDREHEIIERLRRLERGHGGR